MGKEAPKGKYVGTTNCPQFVSSEWTDHAGVAHKNCPTKANVYDCGEGLYMSHCQYGHEHGFGDYYLVNVDQAAEQVIFPEE